MPKDNDGPDLHVSQQYITWKSGIATMSSFVVLLWGTFIYINDLNYNRFERIAESNRAFFTKAMEDHAARPHDGAMRSEDIKHSLAELRKNLETYIDLKIQAMEKD